MAVKLSRNPIRIGSFHLITLPYHWCQFYGDRINDLTIFEDGVLVIAPRGLEKQAQLLINDKGESNAISK